MSNIKFIERLHFAKQMYNTEMFWRKSQGVKLNRLAVAFGAWMDAADKLIIKSKGDLVKMIEKEIRYKNMNGEKPYIVDLLNVMKDGNEVYKGCIIKKDQFGYSWNNYHCVDKETAKQVIDEAILSLNKSIKK